MGIWAYDTYLFIMVNPSVNFRPPEMLSPFVTSRPFVRIVIPPVYVLVC
jgi:hypothetical protein